MYQKKVGFGFPFTPAVKKLLIINVAVLLIMEIITMMAKSGGGLALPLLSFISDFLFLHPIDQGFLPWQLVTYMFFHAGFMHIFFNMFALWMFGSSLESFLGTKRFYWFYFLTGSIGGLIASIYYAVMAGVVLSGPATVIGASGSVFGILLAYAYLWPNQHVYLFFMIPVRVKWLVLFYVAFEVMALGTASQISHITHVGGALTALLFMAIEVPRYRALEHVAQPLRRITDTIRQKIESKKGTSSFGKSKKAKFKVYQNDDYKGSSHDSQNIHDTSSIQQKLDAILAKISSQGIASLTQEEKEFLDQLSNKYRRQ